MKIRHPVFFYAILLSIPGFLSCSQKRSRESVEEAMQTYDRLILKMDVDSIALLYTPDGDLGKIAHGRDSIRSFLERFKNFRVLYQNSKTDFISINVDTATHAGTYRQKVIIAPGDTALVKGTFTVRWIWLTAGGWHIKRIDTLPVK